MIDFIFPETGEKVAFAQAEADALDERANQLEAEAHEALPLAAREAAVLETDGATWRSDWPKYEDPSESSDYVRVGDVLRLRSNLEAEKEETGA